jgi:hypothetical protein
VQVRQRTTDGTTSAALNFGGFRQVRHVDDLDRQAATFFTNDRERRAFADGVLASGGARWTVFHGLIATGMTDAPWRMGGVVRSGEKRAFRSGAQIRKSYGYWANCQEVSWRTFNVRQSSGAKGIRTEVPWLEISVIFFS